MARPTNEMTLSDRGENCIKLWEEDSLKPKLKAYDDGTGKATIGWGCTRGVTMGMTCTVAEAERMFKDEMQEFIAAAQKRIATPLEQYQFDSLVSFFYNEGSAAGAKLVKAINDKRLDDVPAAFRLYNKARHNGKLSVWPGLVERRENEIALWLNIYQDERLPGSLPVPRKPTPPASEPDTQIIAAAKSKTAWSTGIGALFLKAGAIAGVIGAKIDSIFGILPEAQDEAQQKLSIVSSVAKTVHVNYEAIFVWLGLGLLVYAIARHVDLKTWSIK